MGDETVTLRKTAMDHLTEQCYCLLLKMMSGDVVARNLRLEYRDAMRSYFHSGDSRFMHDFERQSRIIEIELIDTSVSDIEGDQEIIILRHMFVNSLLLISDDNKRYGLMMRFMEEMMEEIAKMEKRMGIAKR